MLGIWVIWESFRLMSRGLDQRYSNPPLPAWLLQRPKGKQSRPQTRVQVQQVQLVQCIYVSTPTSVPTWVWVWGLKFFTAFLDYAWWAEIGWDFVSPATDTAATGRSRSPGLFDGQGLPRGQSFQTSHVGYPLERTHAFTCHGLSRGFMSVKLS